MKVDISCETKAEAPARLSDTCFADAIFEGQENTNLFPFEPQYPLFSEGATKRRWIYLPVGKQIDTSNPDGWKFPVGTRLAKEFIVSDRKIETRILEKIAEGAGTASWRAAAYLWRKDQSDADLTQDGLNAQSGVDYELADHAASYAVPATNKCMTCHSGSADVALGFSYLQLSISNGSGTTIEKLNAQALLSPAPQSLDQIRGTEPARKALGYLHANCATCHNASGPASFLPLNHSALVSSSEDENAFKNTVNVANRIVPGLPDSSILYQKVSRGEMPPDSVVKKHIIDQAGLSLLREWIVSLDSPTQIRVPTAAPTSTPSASPPPPPQSRTTPTPVPTSTLNSSLPPPPPPRAVPAPTHPPG